MALDSVCGSLKAGQDLSCISPTSRYYQQMVVMNYSDFDEKTFNIDNSGVACEHNIQFSLKEGKKGFRFTLSDNGTAVNGTFEKSVNDFGYPSYNHIVNFALVGATEEMKCALESMAKGRFIVALQLGDVIEIYGAHNGLSAGDYTADPQGNSGFIALTLQSNESSLEPHVPLVYKANVIGQEIADFDANFEQLEP